MLVPWPPSRISAIVATGREDARTHRIINIADCYGAIRRSGAELHAVPSFGRLSFAQTVQLMRSADVFFTPHGSSLASNFFFLRPGALLAEVWWGGPMKLPANHSDRFLCYSRDSSASEYGYSYTDWMAPWYVDRGQVAALGLAYECLTGKRVKQGNQQNILLDIDFLQHWICRLPGLCAHSA